MGSIIANQGFINQFATTTDPETGEPALDAYHVSLWNAISFASQVLIQLISPITADRFGRKFNMWALTFFLTLVRRPANPAHLGHEQNRQARMCVTFGKEGDD